MNSEEIAAQTITALEAHLWFLLKKYGPQEFVFDDIVKIGQGLIDRTHNVEVIRGELGGTATLKAGGGDE